MKSNTADAILRETAEAVSGERERTHGDKLANHEKIAHFWTTYLQSRRAERAPLTAHDVALMMVLLKLARTQCGEYNPDDSLDLIGYAACAAEISSRLAEKSA